MCLGLATGYREPTDKKERTYADLKQPHFPENKIDTELTSDDFIKALEWVEDYEKAIKEEQAFLNNGDEFHIEALKVCEVVKQALLKQIPKKPIENKNHCYKKCNYFSNDVVCKALQEEQNCYQCIITELNFKRGEVKSLRKVIEAYELENQKLKIVLGDKILEEMRGRSETNDNT